MASLAFTLQALLAAAVLAHPSLAPVASGAPDYSPLNVSDLPPLRQRHGRLLAAINGVWDVLNDQRGKVELLKVVLQGYRHICESGFEVHVVLLTYDAPWAKGVTVPSASDLMCERLGAAVPVALLRHKNEPLPPGAFGTGGTLASKHRRLFSERLAAGYDLFLVHEDDIIVKPHHIGYFAHWAHGPARDPAFHPGFVLFEVLNKQLNRAPLSSRPSLMLFSGGKSFLLTRDREGHSWYRDKWHGTPMFMLTQAQVVNLTAQGWELPENSVATNTSGVNVTHWEYNVWFNTWWLRENLFVGVPVRDLGRALLHHATNKYVKGAGYGLNSFQLQEVVHMCTGDPRPEHFGHFAHFYNSTGFAVEFTPNASSPCRACMDQGLMADVTITDFKPGSPVIHAIVTCTGDRPPPR